MVSLRNVNELYEYLSRKNIHNINKHYVDNNLNTLLHLPQRKDVMKELIQIGGEKDLENVSGATPIMKQYHYETIQYLSTLGARIDKKDIFGFGIFHWPKEAKSLRYIYERGINLCDYSTIYFPKHYIYTFETNTLLIRGGFDPYNESCFSLPGIFLQRNLETIEEYFILRNQYFPQYKDLNDMCHESYLFKVSITPEIIRIYHKYGENMNHINFFGNNALYVHHDIENIRALLECGIDYKYKNDKGMTAEEFHREKKNKDIYILLQRWEKCIIIQKNFRIWKFKINLISPKNYKIKQSLLLEIMYAPPNQTFKGGIEYHKAKEDFHLLIG